MTRCFCIIIVFLIQEVFALEVNAQSVRAFYIGHSLSDQIPDMVQSLSNDRPDDTFDWVYQSIPGAPLRWQWQRKDIQDYEPTDPHFYGFYDNENGLISGEYDVLVLTESVPRYPSIIDETYAYVDSFYNYATTYNPDVQIYINESWHCLLSGNPTNCDDDINTNAWRARLSDDLEMWTSVVDTLNARYQPSHPLCLIPGGQGLAALYDSIQINAIPNIDRIEDIFEDNIHLNDIGKYYIACIHFAMIFRTSPVGLTNQLQYWWGGDFTPPSDVLAAKLQEMAWSIVSTYAGSCAGITTSLSNVTLENKAIYIWPNPTQGRFVITGELHDYDIQILDDMGRVYQEIRHASNEIHINIDTLPDGLYFIRIASQSQHRLIVEKIIKSK